MQPACSKSGSFPGFRGVLRGAVAGRGSGHFPNGLGGNCNQSPSSAPFLGGKFEKNGFMRQVEGPGFERRGGAAHDRLLAPRGFGSRSTAPAALEPRARDGRSRVGELGPWHQRTVGNVGNSAAQLRQGRPPGGDADQSAASRKLGRVRESECAVRAAAAARRTTSWSRSIAIRRAETGGLRPPTIPR